MEQQLATQVVQQLIDRSITITAAESLTAGLFQSTLGSVAGVSAVFPGGFVAYANAVKHQLVGVKTATIDQYSVVSKPVAIEMAQGAKERLNTDLAVSFTGVAGPDSLAGQPAGTVWIGLAKPDGTAVAECYHFSGERNQVREQSVAAGLKLVATWLQK